MPPQVIIRAGRIDDAAVLANFNIRLAWETERLALEPAVITAGVTAALEDATRASYFVAEIANLVVGQLMITHEWSDWRNGDIWWIQSVFVEPDFRRRGVFQALYEHARQQSKRAGAVGLRLYVERHNVSAGATYQRLGMRDAGYNVMEEMFGTTPPDESHGAR